MCTVRLSAGARWSRVIQLLVTLLLSSGQHTFDIYEHQGKNGSGAVILVDAEYELGVICQSSNTNVTCDKLTPIYQQFTVLRFHRCPANIITCINAVAPVPVDFINSLKEFENLNLNEGTLQLPIKRLNSTSLLRLHLHKTNLDKHYPEIFKGLPNLKALKLEGVKIEHISAPFFRGLDSLEHLMLYDNHLKSMESDVFVSIPNLRKLEIIGNSLEILPHHLIERMSFLQVLFIECPKEKYLNGTDMGSLTLARLPALENVTIKHCVLHNLNVTTQNNIDDTVAAKPLIEHQGNDCSPMRFINLKSLKSVELPNDFIDRLSDEMFHNATTLEVLNLSNNKIKELPKYIFNDLTALLHLDLSRNNIKVLHDGIFSNLVALQTLKLSNNAVYMLTTDVFRGLKSLTELYLEHNNIAVIEMYGNLILVSSPFRNLPGLLYLDLSNNKIFGNPFLASDIPNIQYLNVSNNYVDNVANLEDFCRKENVTIDFSHNSIFFAQTNSHRSNDSRLQNCHINLNHNPIVCDCANYNLYLRSIRNREDNTHINLGNTTCSDPPHLKEKIITELSPIDLVCKMDEDDCPRHCKCIIKPATKDMISDCDQMPSTLPNIIQERYPWLSDDEEDYKYSYTLNLKTYPSSISHLNIKTLNLSNTALRNVAFNLTDYLKVLDVSRNNLTTLPDTLLRANITLYVADNPLECDCSLVQGLREDRVADYSLVHCADGTELSKVDVTKLCAWNAVLVKYICIGIITGIFLFKISLIMYRCYMKRKRIHNANFLFRRGSDYSINMEARLDIVKEYDLFLSFAHEDSKFVTDNLLPKLENECDQKVCVHHRDWIAGELIENQIIQSVESSRRTIIILTEAFILSEWSYLEFRTAHNMSIREGKPRVIIILLEESIVNDERLSREVKSYTSVNTYLVWGDPDFWRKLKRILPKRGR